MGIKQLREEEKGSGLVLTLMVLLVLSVLGVAIGTLTIGSYRLSDATRDDTSAYYVAEAGAVATYEEIQKEVLNAYDKNATKGAFYSNVSTILTSKNGKSKVDFGTQFGNKPTATIKTEKLSGADSQTSTIYSTGEIDGKQRTVSRELTVKWVDKNTGGGFPVVPTNAALLTQGNNKKDAIDIGGNSTLIGDTHTNLKESGSIKVSGNATIKSDLHYPSETTAEKLIDIKGNTKWDGKYKPRNKDIDFKNYSSLLDQGGKNKYNSKNFKRLEDIDIEHSHLKIEVQENIFFEEIEIDETTLTLDPMGGNHTILVNKLSIESGNLNIVGKGTITLVVTEEMDFEKKVKINVPGNSNQLLLVGYPNDSIGNDDDDDDDDDKLYINGVFLTNSKKINLSGNNKSSPSNVLLIAPSATINLSGQYQIRGTIITETIKMKGGSSLEYQAIDTTGFPFGSTGTTSDPKPEDIISSGTITED